MKARNIHQFRLEIAGYTFLTRHIQDAVDLVVQLREQRIIDNKICGEIWHIETNTRAMEIF